MGAVRCGDPGTPMHSVRTGSTFTFGSTLAYSCVEGYHMEGSHKLQCVSSGNWLGRLPECRQITCDDPFAPRHGRALTRRQTYGSKVRFECDDGYNLVGNQVLECAGDGEWNGTEPHCEATTCDPPGNIEHGSKDGSIYYYPYNVTFSCFVGYQLRGNRQITCQTNRQWSSPVPTCEACPQNTFMNRSHGSCTPCLPNSHTLTEASTSRMQCICDVGYSGEPGRPCQEIRCPELASPDNGQRHDCDNKLGSACTFDCNDGYILEKGTAIRRCQEGAGWDGSQPICSACPINTYKSDIRSCLPCPQHSQTTGEASISTDCICKEGYTGPPGGPCTDLDECAENSGNGPCQDLCQNNVGAYTCACSIPGYKINPDTMHTCIVEKQCKNLTEDEVPENGGVVCHWYQEENSQQCAAKCNKGYEFPSRINDYETCGPSTGYIWTFRREDLNATFTPCIIEFFPEYRVEGMSSYFVRACNELNETEITEVKHTFAATLNEYGVCKKRETQICDIKSMALICGRRTIRRRRRGVMETLTSVDLLYDVKAIKIQEKPKDCDRICQFLRIPMRFCDKLCLVTYKRFLKAAVTYAKGQLAMLYANRLQNLTFSAANREFDPERRSLYMSNVVVVCAEGMKTENDKCVACDRGTYLDKNECKQCRSGTYQPLQGQSVCITCPIGTTTTKTGSKFCQVCPVGRWGNQCTETCECVHGYCNPRTGHCACKAGWEGSSCNIDIPGCRNNDCFENVGCTDITAPGTGFKCRPCPTGLTGDGSNCV